MSALDEPLAENLESLEKWVPSRFFGRLRELAEKPFDEGEPALRIETGRGDKPPRYIAHGETGKDVSLHSSRDPVNEAIRQVDAWDDAARPVQWDGALVVLGMGGGYHVAEIIRRAKPGACVAVIDPKPEMVISLARQARLREIIPTPEGVNVLFLVSEDILTLSRAFRALIAPRASLSLSVFRHPALNRAFPTLYGEALKAINAEFGLECMDRGTMAYLSDKWTRNATWSLPYILNNPPVNAVKNRFEGRDAIVAAAGPSLAESLDMIRELAKSATLIAVGTAYKPLTQAGIVPDFVTAIDWDPVSWRQFQGIVPGETWLLADGIAYGKILELFKDRLFTFHTSALKEFWTWFELIAPSPDTLAVGGTVTVSALDAAGYMGAKNIYAFGLDLAYAEDGSSHVTGSMYQGQRLERNKLIPVPGNAQDVVYTTKQFAKYIRMMEAFCEISAKKRDVTYYNVNSGGARILNMIVIQPEAARRMIAGPNWDFKQDIRDARRDCPAMGADRERVANASEITMTELRAAETIAAEGVAILDKAVAKNATNLSAADLRALENIDKRLKENKNGLSLINGAIKSACMNALNGAKDDAADPEQRQRAALARSLALYQQIQGAATTLVSAMSEAFDYFNDARRD